MRKTHNPTGGLSAPQEFNETLEQPPVVEEKKIKTDDSILICASRPTKEVVIPAAGGKTRTVVVVDKHRLFSLPNKELAARAASIAVRPGSGYVTVYDKAGVMIAKYGSASEALRRLTDAKVDLEKVSIAGQLKPQ